MKQRLFISVLVVIAACATALPCAAAQKKKDTLNEKMSKDKRLTYLDDFKSETMYIYDDTVVKGVPTPYMPSLSIGKEDKKLQPRSYTFWAISVLKPAALANLKKTAKSAVYLKTKWEVGCDKNTYEIHNGIYYNASGSPVKEMAATGELEAPPDTVASTIISRVCSYMASNEAWREGLPAIPPNPLNDKPDDKL